MQEAILYFCCRTSEGIKLNRIKFDINIIGFMSVFENSTHAKLKDCMTTPNGLLFIVEPNEIAKAIGKQGQNAKRLEHVLKKKIKIVEFSPEVGQFIRNLLHPLQVDEIEEAGNGLVILKGRDTQSKSMIIGRSASNLRGTEEIVKRYFPIEEIKII